MLNQVHPVPSPAITLFETISPSVPPVAPGLPKRRGRPQLLDRLTPEALAEIGRLLIGPEWQRPMARLLGSLHPEGVRETMDPRLIQRWSNGSRRVPDWVMPVLADLLAKRAVRLRAEADVADVISRRLLG